MTHHRRATWLRATTLLLLTGTLAAQSKPVADRPGPDRPSRHLAVAEGAGRWLIDQAIRDDGAWTWQPCPDAGGAVSLDLYTGGAGVVLLFCELHAATGEDTWLDAAIAAGLGLRRGIDELAETGDAGLFTGVGGPLLAMQVLHEHLAGSGHDDLELDRAIRRGLDWYGERAGVDESTTDTESAISFGPVTDIISGDAGIGELMLWFADRRPHSPARRVAAGIARHLIEIAEPTKPGFRWPMEPGYPRWMPNYSHGTAGVAAFLVAARALHPQALKTATGGAERFLHLADERGLVYHHAPEGEELFYWSWCHGPAGSSVLFERLADADRTRAEWADAVRRPLGPILRSGLPDRRLAGLWNTVGQCCGTAGVGAYVLRHTHDNEDALTFCETLADDIRARATEVDDGLMWVQAEHRSRPQLLQAQVGWAQGASGIGLWLVHLDGALRDRKPSFALPWTR